MELDYEDLDVMPKDKRTIYPQDDQESYDDTDEWEDKYPCYS